MKDNKIRLQKHLSESGVASRRKAEELIEAGKVRVNGRIAHLGDKVDPKRDKVSVNGKTVIAQTQKVYIMLHKPRGFVTTMKDEMDRKCVTDLVKDVGVKVFPVGRLDRNSEGLLIMTNDGGFANDLTHPSAHVNKTYRVTVSGEVTDEKLLKMKEGILLDGTKTLPCDVFIAERKADRTVLIFIIHEGRNRQVRRMCAKAGMQVKRLIRIQEGTLRLGNLPSGMWRFLTADELEAMQDEA